MRTSEATKWSSHAKRIVGILGVPSQCYLGEGHVGIEVLDRDDVRTPRGLRGPHVRKERAAKARNHSRVAEALPHSEGTAYKPPCGEIAMCARVGRMGPIKC